MDFIDLVKNEIITKYDCLNVDEAPTSTGLYAWYGINEISNLDYKIEIVNGVDLGISRTSKRLSDISKRYAMPDISLRGEGAFSTRWNGSFRDETINNLINYIDTLDNEIDDCKLIREILVQPAERDKLSKIIGSVVPYTSAPIYIGVAENLKQRLTTHADNVKILSELLASRKTNREELIANCRKHKNNFAIRAVSMGFKVESLNVYVFNVDKFLGCTNNRKVSELAEWFLNKWNKPILGEK